MGLFHHISHFVHHISHSLTHSTLGSVLNLVASLSALVAVASGNYLLAFLITTSMTALNYFGRETPSIDNTIKDNGYLVSKLAKINEPIPIVYGTCRLGGNTVFLKTAGSKNENLYQAFTISEGIIEGVLDIYLDDKTLMPLKPKLKGSSLHIYSVKNTVTNLKGKIKVSVPFEVSYYEKSWTFDEWGNIEPTYIEKTKTVIVEKEIDVEIGINDEIKTYSVSATFNLGDYDDSNTYTKEVITITMYDLTNGERQVRIDSINGATIEGITWTAYSTDNGNSYYSIDLKKINKVDFMYFDGYDLWAVDKSTNALVWVKVDQYHPLFKEFVDNGFMVLNYNESDKYDVALDKLRKNKVAVFMSKLIYDKNVWKNIPQITVLVNGIKRATPFNTSEHILTNPIEILYDYLTNTVYGVGIPEDKIDLNSWKLVYDYANTKGFSFNGVITGGKVDDVIKNILNHFRGELIYKLGKWELRFKDLPIERNWGLVYPDVVELDESNDSINITYPDISSMYDQVEVSFINPNIDYKSDTILIP
jgi:hypothetical protein